MGLCRLSRGPRRTFDRLGPIAVGRLFQATSVIRPLLPALCEQAVPSLPSYLMIVRSRSRAGPWRLRGRFPDVPGKCLPDR